MSITLSSPCRSQSLHRRYEFEFDVGEWPYGTVQVVKDRRTGSLKTCKSVQKQLLQDPASTAQRLRKLCDVRLPHVNGLTDVVEDSDNIFLLSDRCLGGDLNDWMDQLDEHHWLQEDIIAAYIAQALVALAHCHAHHVYHLDLSPSTILLTSRLPDATIMVSDFGLQAVLDPDCALAKRDPSSYMAPELVSDTGRVLCGGAPDIWSIGAIARLLLVGAMPGMDPSWDLSPGGFLRNIQGGEEWAERSAASRDFVSRLLQPAGHRPTAARMLQHPWLRHSVIPRVVHGRPGHEDLSQRVVCYMAAVLLVPALLLHGDFSRLLNAFKRADEDYDGLVLRSVAHELLQEHSVHESTVDTWGEDEIEDALEIADVKGTGIFDFCATAVAAMLAKRLPRTAPSGTPTGPSRAAELLPLVADAFFEVYGKARQPAIETSRLIHQLRNQVGRDLELHGGVDFDELLSAFAGHSAIDRESFLAGLSLHAGRGTPISYAQDESEDTDANSDRGSESSWEPLEGVHGLFSAMESCGLLPETRRMLKNLLDLHCVQCLTAG